MGETVNLLLLLQAHDVISGCCRPAGAVITHASYLPACLGLHTLLSLHHHHCHLDTSLLPTNILPINILPVPAACGLEKQGVGRV